ncbi:MAG: hypothetical protein ICCCNLDF_03331 [Planctomycetes bacterium]|nr:hypothetical protein [Planctomycetota bacterium]
MEKKTVLPAVTIALLSCIALMLTVIGGLYAYNTFAGSAQPVAAQSSGTDKGPDWSATSVTVGGDQEFIVVIKEVENPYEQGQKATQMAVYEVRPNSTAKAELFFVASRLLEYDFKLPDHSGEDSKGKGWSPLGVKKAVEDSKKK